MKMAPDESKLKPFFRGPQNLVNNVGANSQEVRKLIYRSIKYECLSDYTQCPRANLNKRFLPRAKTTTA